MRKIYHPFPIISSLSLIIFVSVFLSQNAEAETSIYHNSENHFSFVEETKDNDFASALLALRKAKEAQEKKRLVVFLSCTIAGSILLIWGFCSFVKREKRLYGPMYGNIMASIWTFGIIAGCLTLLAGAVELDDNGLVEALPYLNFSCLFFCGAWFLTSYLKGKFLKEEKEAPLNSSSKGKRAGNNQVRPD